MHADTAKAVPDVGPASTDDPRHAMLGLYRPSPELFVRGEGPWLETDQGQRFLDFTSGIAVTALGHGSPLVRRAIEDALECGLIHTSNLFRTPACEQLALQLVEVTFPGKVFFCNSGAEANEASLKFARRWARVDGPHSKYEIITFRGSFHGRMFGTVSITDRAAYREPFEPLVPGVQWAEVGNIESVRAVAHPDRTAAIIIEPIQGEGGVMPVPPAFLTELRAVADECGAALIFDEVQCGFSRSGRLFAYQYGDALPDMLTVAKPIAGGLPMGAVIVAPHVASAMQPGDHGTTFGGGPLVSSVARAVLCTVTDPSFIEGVQKRHERFVGALAPIVEQSSLATGVRGRGLILGLKLNAPRAADVVAAAHREGLLLVGAGPDVVRMLPPLNIDEDLLDEAAHRLARALATVEAAA